MSLADKIADLFDFIFFSSNPEKMKKRELRKFENELRIDSPCIFRTNLLTPDFANGLYILSKNTQQINTILQNTILNESKNTATNYIDLLIASGLSDEDCTIIASFNYERRKMLLKASENQKRTFEQQKANLDKVLKDIRVSVELKKIEQVLAKLFQLNDICSFDYTSFLRFFYPDYTPDKPEDELRFSPIPIIEHEVRLLDFYYVIKDFSASNSLLKAIIALAEQKNAKQLSAEQKNELTECLKKISYVFLKIIKPESLLKIICLLKKDTQFTPETNKYEHNYIDEYARRLKETFEADQQRITNELKDEELKSELEDIFADKELSTVEGYNNESNEILQRTSTQMFNYTTPLQILKTFSELYITDPIVALLNDIVVEGFFVDPSEQNTFATAVYTITEFKNTLAAFEESFKAGGENDFSSLSRLAANSKGSEDLSKQLISRVAAINANARVLLYNSMKDIKKLTQDLIDMYADTKSGTPKVITNVKLILFSIRNRENAATLELQLPKWENFINLMKNYVLFADKE